MKMKIIRKNTKVKHINPQYETEGIGVVKNIIKSQHCVTRVEVQFPNNFCQTDITNLIVV